ncbi:MAG: DUF4363 family protein [Firmicutes bacterium]|nr:DUF4363 family protein [Bacillota bacterium]
MKRIVAAVVLAAVIAVLAVVGRMTVSTNTDKIDRLLASAYDSALAGDFAAAANYASDAEKSFVECEEYISIFVDSSLVNDFGVAIGRLPLLAHEEMSAEFLSECAATHIMLIHIAEGDKPILTNIF